MTAHVAVIFTMVERGVHPLVHPDLGVVMGPEGGLVNHPALLVVEQAPERLTLDHELGPLICAARGQLGDTHIIQPLTSGDTSS